MGLCCQSFALSCAVLLCSSALRADDAPVPVAVVVATKPSKRLLVDLAPEERSVAERMAEVQSRVQAAASYPKIAQKRGVEGETLVSFEIASNGTPHSSTTERSSGSLLLDRAALAAVEQAAPLPWIYGRVAVPVRFVLKDAN